MPQPHQPSDSAPPSGWTLRAPGWEVRPPGWPAPAPDARAAPRQDAGSLVLAAVAGAAVLAVGLLVAALLSALLISFVLANRSDDVGRGIAEAMGGSAPQSGPLGGYGYGPPEQHEPVPPGSLGTDPALNGYAQECFAGTLDACDALYLESTPLSEYERYGSTCGGRVKPLEVYSCTELE